MIYKGYLKSKTDAETLLEAIDSMKVAGVAVDNIQIGGTFVDVVEQLTQGEILIVNSLTECDCNSLRELFATIVNVSSRGAYMRSLEETWFDMRHAPDWNMLATGFETIDKRLHSIRTNSGLKKATDRGCKLGRPTGTIVIDKVKYRNCYDVLATNSQMKVKEVCEIYGISTGYFYKYLKKENLTLCRKRTRTLINAI